MLRLRKVNKPTTKAFHNRVFHSNSFLKLFWTAYFPVQVRLLFFEKINLLSMQKLITRNVFYRNLHVWGATRQKEQQWTN